jgi:hypothetical protein
MPYGDGLQGMLRMPDRPSVVSRVINVTIS